VSLLVSRFILSNVLRDLEKSIQVDYVPHNLSHFCSDGIHYATMDALVQLSNPPVTQATAWSVFAQVLPIVQPMGIIEGITLSLELL
jgi:hypothetical protein